MVLDIRRKFIPANQDPRWESAEYEVVVWSWRLGLAQKWVAVLPDGYTGGTYTCYINDRQVHVQAFDDVLASILPGTTRESLVGGPSS